MDIKRILMELKKQRRAIDVAISALEGADPTRQKDGRFSDPSRKGSKTARNQTRRKSRPGSAQAMGKLIPFHRFRRKKKEPSKAEQA